MKKRILIRTLAVIAIAGATTGALAAANNFEVTLKATPAAQALMGANTKVELICGKTTSTISLGSVLGASTNYFSGNSANCLVKLKNSYGLFEATPSETTSAAFKIAPNKTENYKINIPQATTNILYASPIIVRDAGQAESVAVSLSSVKDADQVASHQLVIKLDATKAN